MLYLVPTPIGNLEDITYRAIKVLKSVDSILAEDTRQTRKLLQHYDINTRLEAYHAHNEHKVTSKIIDRLLVGENLALVSDAGSPGISDPGYLLVHEIRSNKVPIEIDCLPGATALIPALTGSGLSSDRFYFEGFLPQKKGRKTRWDYLQTLDSTIVLYESPYRLLKCLREIKDVWGSEKRVSVSRELTKIHQETVTDTVEEVLKNYENRTTIKGEIVIIIGKI